MSVTSGLHAADGSWRVTVVSGTTNVGLMAHDGSVNVISSPGNTSVGAQHPCGALWVTLVSATSPIPNIRALDGSLNVSVSTYIPRTQYVTVVSGNLGPGAGGAINYYPILFA